MQNYVFVLDTNKVPQEPVHPGAARRLLMEGKAAVYRRVPFTLILKEAMPETETSPITLKIDPGSKTTGIVLVQACQTAVSSSMFQSSSETTLKPETVKPETVFKVIFAAHLLHRGQQIKESLESRRAIRRSRRNRKTRYRKARFANRTRKEGWLAPSLQSRVDNIQTWFVRFLKLCNLKQISMELVRFDMQLMQDAEISGVDYQQGELQGYEVRQYLLEKFGHKCCYCGKTGIPLQIEHIHPKSRGGSNRVSNLCTACGPCNVEKGTKTAAEFGHPEVQALAKKPLKDAAAVNTTRWAIWRMFEATGIHVEVGTGGRTKFNRTSQAYPKAHWIDSACVGESGQAVRYSPQAAKNQGGGTTIPSDVQTRQVRFSPNIG